jgi:hypothetical protein
MSAKKRYKIINDTIKPIKLNAKGQDMRSTRDRVGSVAQFYIGEPPVLTTIYQNRSTIIDELNDQVIGLHKKGAVTIEVINDITDELKQFSQKPAALPVEKTEKVFASPETNPGYVPKTPADLKAKASVSGAPANEEKMVYPDGEPNFVAKAPVGGPKRVRKEEPVAETAV